MRVPLLLASVENSSALADWIIATAAAWLPIRERIAHCRAILSRPPSRPSPSPPSSFRGSPNGSARSAAR
jgi:hypothetical protein